MAVACTRGLVWLGVWVQGVCLPVGGGILHSACRLCSYLGPMARSQAWGLEVLNSGGGSRPLNPRIALWRQRLLDIGSLCLACCGFGSCCAVCPCVYVCVCSCEPQRLPCCHRTPHTHTYTIRQPQFCCGCCGCNCSTPARLIGLSCLRACLLAYVLCVCISNITVS